MAAFKEAVNFVKEFAAEPSYLEAQAAAAGKVQRIAEAIAPHDTGHYQRSFHIDEQEGTLSNSDIAAHLIESGSINNPPYAPLRRAVVAAGFTLIETPKP